MMRLFLYLTVVAALGVPAPVAAQTPDRMNPIIALHEKGLPAFGIAHPQIASRGGGRRGRGRGADAGAATTTPPPPIDLAAAAMETVAYDRADYLYTSGASETFLRYIEEITKVGGSMRTHPFTAKIGIWHRDPEAVTERIINQLNAGHSNVSMEAVESAEEVRSVIKAMRLVSAGGTRPETGLENAAAYWGLTVDEYKERADVWPINPKGELLISVIVESLDGLANIKEIAAEPGVGEIFAGYGTLGGVFRGDPEGREAAAAKILDACKEFDVPAGFPVNNPEEMEQRMKEGWSVFIMQRRDETSLAAIETGRRLSERK
jgi:2-keto-3-deoxy-L-rhamnonate aldolase RhmA